MEHGTHNEPEKYVYKQCYRCQTCSALVHEDDVLRKIVDGIKHETHNKFMSYNSYHECGPVNNIGRHKVFACGWVGEEVEEWDGME